MLYVRPSPEAEISNVGGIRSGRLVKCREVRAPSLASRVKVASSIRRVIDLWVLARASAYAPAGTLRLESSGNASRHVDSSRNNTAFAAEISLRVITLAAPVSAPRA